MLTSQSFSRVTFPLQSKKFSILLNAEERLWTVWTQQCSLSRQPCFSPTTELSLMDLCLPEESEVVFLCWTMRRDGGPPSIHHLISGHWAETIRAALCPLCVSMCRWYHFHTPTPPCSTLLTPPPLLCV